MVTFSENVERWRNTVDSELSRASIPFPTDLILALIHTESRGKPGSVNAKSGASGLTQVMPGTLEWYNERHAEKIPLSLLQSSSGGQAQIRVGLWVLAQFWKSAYKYLRDTRGLKTIPTIELAKLADLFYVAGPGATRRKADKVAIPFYEAIATKYPTWNALPHPVNVFKKLDSVQWDLPAISTWLEGSVTDGRKVAGSVILTIGVILIAYWFLMRGEKNGEKKEK